MGSTVVEVLLGAVVAIFITIWTENLRKPRLKIRIADPIDREYEGRPAKFARFLSVNVINEALPRWARWMSRNSATQCHATITFHHLDGQNVFGRTMPTRWSRSPEPVPAQVVFDNKVLLITDPTKFEMNTRFDIFSGESEELNIAARFDDDSDCFNWSNENYFCDPPWRHPRWRLSPRRYLVKVVVTTAGEKVAHVFRLVNDVPRQDFRLEPKIPGDPLPL